MGPVPSCASVLRAASELLNLLLDSELYTSWNNHCSMDICGLHFLPCSFTSFICILELTNPREASQRSFICMKELQFVDFGFCLYEPRLFLCFLQSPVWVAPKTASLGFESFETPNNFNLFHSLKSLLVNRISGQTPTPPILWGTFLGGIHPLGFSGGPGRTEPL